MSALRVTAWGSFVSRYSVQTPPSWWKAIEKEVERVADHDGDWVQMIQERILGLQELLERRTNEGSPEYWRTPQDIDKETDR